VALAAGLAVVVVEKLRPGDWSIAAWWTGLIGVDDALTASQHAAVLAASAVAAALAAGLAAAAIWVAVRRATRLQGAIEIDRRFELSERVSSAVLLDESMRGSPAGQALSLDAVRHVEGLHVPRRFRLSLPKWSWLALVPAVAAFLLAIFVPPTVREDQAAAAAARANRLHESVQFERQAERTRQKAEEQGMEETAAIIEELIEGQKKIAEMNEATPEKMALEFQDLAELAESRRSEVATEELRAQLEQLKNVPRGPADEMAKAMKSGDFQRAADALEELAQQLANGDLDAAKREEMAQQFRKMQEKLNELAQTHREAMRELQRQMEAQQAQGNKQQAAALKERLDRLASQLNQMQMLESLGECLGQCSGSLGNGDPQAAMNALKQQLESLAERSNELALLNEALDALGQCQAGMCKGNGNKIGPASANARASAGGPRPEDESDTGFFDTRAKLKPGEGPLVIEDFVDGLNTRGDFEQAIRTEFAQSKGGEADPMVNQPLLSRAERDQAREYFDALNGVSPEEPAE
jgi:HAMP domain-containing protein